MKVITTVSNGIAISPQKVVKFTKGDILEVGYKGLTEKNITRLLDIGFAKPYDSSELIQDAPAEEVDKDEVVDVETEPKQPETEDTLKEEFPDFSDKEELEAYAADRGIELDKRKSLANMVKEFKEKLGA